MSGRRGVQSSSVPKNPKITDIETLVDDIYLRYIALDADDFEKYYKVIDNVFGQLHNKMKAVDPYYNKYSSQTQFAGSHPDRLRIKKPDEFDMDIVIGLPLDKKVNPYQPQMSDFIIEPREPGFVQLKVGSQFDHLPYRDGNQWEINKTAYKWKDEKNYLLRSNFINWFKSVVDRALNCFTESPKSPPKITVDYVSYTVTRTSGQNSPAVTLYIENRDHEFKLDVDLVPALRFPNDRWPITNNYKKIPSICENAGKDYWLVVPKPCDSEIEHDRNRSWRIAMHEHEATLMHDLVHMKQAIRLIKKLCDSQNMKIVSYYIKTIFFWEVMEQHKTFWEQSPVEIFKFMLKKFQEYLEKGNIPYFWQENNNLVEKINKEELKKYARIVKNVLDILNVKSQYKQIAKFLLTKEEYNEYNRKFLNN